MRQARLWATLAVALLVSGPTTVAQGVLRFQAPVYKTKEVKAGTSYKPLKLTQGRFELTVKLLDGPAGATLHEEVLGYTVQSDEASTPAELELTVASKVVGLVDVVLGADPAMPLPAEVASSDVWFTTQVTRFNKKGAAIDYATSPAQPLGLSGYTRGLDLAPRSLDVEQEVKVGSLVVPTDAVPGYVLTSDTEGLATWQPADVALNAIGSEQVLDESLMSVDLGTDSVSADEIATGAVGNAEIADGAVDGAKIAAGAVGSAELAAGAVGSGEIADGAVDGTKIAAGAVGSGQIVTGAVGSAAIADGAVGSAELAAGAVGSAQIATNAVGSAEIADGAVGSAEIADGAVGSAEIAKGAVGSAEIATNAVGSSEIAANAVSSSELADGAVGSPELADGAVTATKLAMASVTFQALASDSVGGDQLLSGSVTSSKIAVGAVGSLAISSGAVDTGELSDEAVSTSKLAPNAVDSSKILNGTITASDIATGAIGTPQIVDGAVSGAKIASGAVTGSKIADGSILSSDIAAGAVGASEVADDAIDTGEIEDFGLEGEDISTYDGQIYHGQDPGAVGNVEWMRIEVGDLAYLQTADVIDIHIPSDASSQVQFIEANKGSDTEFRLDSDGDAYADGSWNGGGADYADLVRVLPRADVVEPGDVLVLEPGASRAVARSTTGQSPLVAGVYSTRPAFVGWGGRETDLPDPELALLDALGVGGPGTHAERIPLELRDAATLYDEVPLALVGIVPCKVSAENGPIRTGDLLVTSWTPGHAMRDDAPRTGTVLGKAMGELTHGTGVIDVLLMLR